MKHLAHRYYRNGTQEWLSAFFTLLVLTGVYSSMDHISPYSIADTPQPSKPTETSTVAPPYWNQELGYGFRSIAGDRYSASGNTQTDTVLVTPGGQNPTHDGVSVSYFKNMTRDTLDASLDKSRPRAYSTLPHGIAVIEGDIESASAKTIVSTLHSQ